MTTPRKTPAQPVANLRQARKELAASKAAHPAGKKVAPAAKAPAKAAKPAEVETTTYAATGRGGVERRSTSATPLVAAVDCKIANRKGAHFAKGTVIAFYVDRAKAEAAATKINAAGGDWSDAVVVPAKPVSA
jgi:hypothetical protein